MEMDEVEESVQGSEGGAEMHAEWVPQLPAHDMQATTTKNTTVVQGQETSASQEGPTAMRHDTAQPSRFNRDALTSWQHEPVNMDSEEYRSALAHAEVHFIDWLREVALRGELLLEEVNSVAQRRAVLAVATRNGYELDSKRSTCQFVYVSTTNHLFLRGSWKNPFVAEAVAQDLYELHCEAHHYEDMNTPHAEPRTLRWYFVDRVLHHDMLHLVRLLGYACGVFRGSPAASYTEQAKLDNNNSRVDCSYVYKLEVACDNCEHASWAEEQRLLMHASTHGLQHPLPMPRQVMQNRQGMYHYCHALRPFFYHWTPHVTRCKLDLMRNRDFRDGRVPEYVRSFCAMNFLRHEVDADGRLYLRLSLRSAFYVFLRYATALQACDTAAVHRRLQTLQASNNVHNDSNSVELLNEAKASTPHFGMFHFCLEHRFLTRELREMQHFAGDAHYYVYVKAEAGVLDCIIAVSRDLPALNNNSNEECMLYFLPTGAYVGPERYASLVDAAYGTQAAPPPSLHSLIATERKDKKDEVEEVEEEEDEEDEMGHTMGLRNEVNSEAEWRRRPRSPSDTISNVSHGKEQGQRSRQQRSTSRERQRRRHRTHSPDEHHHHNVTPSVPSLSTLQAAMASSVTSTGQRRRYLWPRSVPLTEFYNTLLQRQGSVFVSPGVTQETHNVIWRRRDQSEAVQTAEVDMTRAVPVTFLVNHLTRTAQVIPSMPPPGWLPQ